MKVFKHISHSGKSGLVLSPLFVVLVIGMLSMQSIAQNCNSVLKVHSDRDTRAANENDPTTFQLELTNSSSKSISYGIVAVKYGGECKVDKYPSPSDSDINLDVSIMQRGLKSNNLVVPANSTKSFQAMVRVPRNTPINRWSCIEIQANSDGCILGEVSSIIKVFISDYTED